MQRPSGIDPGVLAAGVLADPGIFFASPDRASGNHIRLRGGAAARGYTVIEALDARFR
ncbi:hypothetical protein ACIP9X_20375 [Arthrobacter sp. NPDC093125]|uniref:hypothetical protein n=1 Tax=Arthrobacter sp. NPDC093125 TaxID=3363944 RepID=UPI00380BC79C